MKTVPRHRLSSATTSLLDTLFPPVCAGCGRRGHWVCGDCAGEVAEIGAPWCGRCGAMGRSRCVCLELPEVVIGIRSAMPFDGWVRSAIHALKYEGERARARHLGDLLLPLLPSSAIDLVVPVPLHPRRLRQRGFNQAALLAARVSGSIGVELLEIDRQGSTTPQVGLATAERRANVAGAFTVSSPTRIAGRAVVLVDDVITTTATMCACAEAIVAAGAASVLCVSVARAVSDHRWAAA